MWISQEFGIVMFLFFIGDLLGIAPRMLHFVVDFILWGVLRFLGLCLCAGVVE